jgi:hypothetical protein
VVLPFVDAVGVVVFPVVVLPVANNVELEDDDDDDEEEEEEEEEEEAPAAATLAFINGEGRTNNGPTLAAREHTASPARSVILKLGGPAIRYTNVWPFFNTMDGNASHHSLN